MLLFKSNNITRTLEQWVCHRNSRIDIGKIINLVFIVVINSRLGFYSHYLFWYMFEEWSSEFLLYLSFRYFENDTVFKMSLERLQCLTLPDWWGTWGRQLELIVKDISPSFFLTWQNNSSQTILEWHFHIVPLFSHNFRYNFRNMEFYLHNQYLFKSFGTFLAMKLIILLPSSGLWYQ